MKYTLTFHMFDTVGEFLNVAAELASGVSFAGQNHAGGKLRRYI